MEGKGKLKWQDGRKYIGEFRDGKEEGEGTFKWPNGNKYIGQWKDGKMTGYALFIDMAE